MINKLIKYLALILFCFINNYIFSQDLKTTEIRVVEGLDVSVPDANKLNVKAFFMDTTKIDKTQKYSFVDKALYSSFNTRPLTAARIKNKNQINTNSTNISLAFGNNSYQSGKFNFSKMYNRSFYYGIGLSIQNREFTTSTDELNVVRKNPVFYLYAKNIFKKNIVSSKISHQRITTNHGFSKSSESQFSYSELSLKMNSRGENNSFDHISEISLKDLNSKIENHVFIGTEISKTINSIPIALELEFNNYLNYQNNDDILDREELDVKILDISPKLSFAKYGFDINIGFNLGIENNNSENTADIFPLLEISKELVDNVINLSFGVDRSDYRNTLASLTKENPYIHSFGLNANEDPSLNIVDTINFSHKLETTDIYEAFLNLDNKLSNNEMLSFKLAYGKIFNHHSFILTTINDQRKFEIEYLDVWQLRANAFYQKEFNNLIALNIDINYNWHDELVSNKAVLTGQISLPVTLRNKIKASPSLNYIGPREALILSGLFIEPAEYETIQLDHLYFLDLDINYNYSEKIGFSIKANNILNVSTPFWNGYEEMGINFSLGLNYIF
ncbi:MAG: hypothetical protein ISR02_04980 [Flavobacteriales bacterium]|nr:hypothetical protein [Flavobacteriales bacterium]